MNASLVSEDLENKIKVHNSTILMFYTHGMGSTPVPIAEVHDYFTQYYDHGYLVEGDPMVTLGFRTYPFIGFVDLTTGVVRGRTTMNDPHPTVEEMVKWAEEANQTPR